jgi:hypothetical protein
MYFSSLDHLQQVLQMDLHLQNADHASTIAAPTSAAKDVHFAATPAARGSLSFPIAPQPTTAPAPRLPRAAPASSCPCSASTTPVESRPATPRRIEARRPASDRCPADRGPADRGRGRGARPTGCRHLLELLQRPRLLELHTVPCRRSASPSAMLSACASPPRPPAPGLLPQSRARRAPIRPQRAEQGCGGRSRSAATSCHVSARRSRG